MAYKKFAWCLMIMACPGDGSTTGGSTTDETAGETAAETSGDTEGDTAAETADTLPTSSSDGSDTTDPTTTTETTGAPEGSGFEELDDFYEACGPPMAPKCVNLGCGDDASSKYVAMLVEEIHAAGVADRIRMTDADLYPDTNQFLYDLQSQVGWFRYWTPSQIDTSDSDDEIRADFRHTVDLLVEDLPASVIPREDVVAAASACVGLVYDGCSGHTTPTTVYVLRETGDVCNGGTADEIHINVATGEVTCTPDAPVGCAGASRP